MVRRYYSREEPALALAAGSKVTVPGDTFESVGLAFYFDNADALVGLVKAGAEMSGLDVDSYGRPIARLGRMRSLMAVRSLAEADGLSVPS